MQFLGASTACPLHHLPDRGPARWFAEAASEDDIACPALLLPASASCRSCSGGAARLLVSDAGFPGLVLRIACVVLHPPRRTVAPRTVDGLSPPRPEADGTANCLRCSRNCAGRSRSHSIRRSPHCGWRPRSAGMRRPYGQEVCKPSQVGRSIGKPCKLWSFHASECGFSYQPQHLINSTPAESAM